MPDNNDLWFNHCRQCVIKRSLVDLVRVVAQFENHDTGCRELKAQRREAQSRLGEFERGLSDE
jgi:hypothetical protein